MKTILTLLLCGLSISVFSQIKTVGATSPNYNNGKIIIDTVGLKLKSWELYMLDDNPSSQTNFKLLDYNKLVFSSLKPGRYWVLGKKATSTYNYDLERLVNVDIKNPTTCQGVDSTIRIIDVYDANMQGNSNPNLPPTTTLTTELYNLNFANFEWYRANGGNVGIAPGIKYLNNSRPGLCTNIDGSEMIYLVITDNNGCTSLGKFSNIISPLVFPSSFGVPSVGPVTVSVPTVTKTSYTYCQDDISSNLIAVASTGNTLKWYDVETGGTALSNPPTPNTNSAGTTTYYVSQKDANNNESARVAISVVVNSKPIVNASFTMNGNEVIFVNNSSNATNYHWDFNDLTNSTETSPNHTFNSDGVYNVILNAYNGSCTGTSSFTVNVSKKLTGLTEILKDNIQIYPNPTKDLISIKNIGNSNYHFQIHDLNGKMIHQNEINNETISLKSFVEEGIYFISILNENEELIKKSKIILY